MLSHTRRKQIKTGIGYVIHFDANLEYTANNYGLFSKYPNM